MNGLLSTTQPAAEASPGSRLDPLRVHFSYDPYPRVFFELPLPSVLEGGLDHVVLRPGLVVFVGASGERCWTSVYGAEHWRVDLVRGDRLTVSFVYGGHSDTFSVPALPS